MRLAIYSCVLLLLLSCFTLGFGKYVKTKNLKRVRRGNFGERGSGGLGSRGAQGVGYGGTTALGSHTGGGGSGVVFDYIAQNAIRGGSQAVLDGYQAQVNAQASSAQSLDRLQQQGQHSAANAGAAANQVGAWYNAIATGPVPAGYKGESG